MKDPRESMINAFIDAVADGINLLVTVSDSTSTSKIEPFAKRFPDRVVNVGIAEQNLIGLSSGLALGGYVVATANAAPFLVNRSAEQVKKRYRLYCYKCKNDGIKPGLRVWTTWTDTPLARRYQYDEKPGRGGHIYTGRPKRNR